MKGALSRKDPERRNYKLAGSGTLSVEKDGLREDFSDDETETILKFIDTLDPGVFGPSSRDMLKLRMFFKPLETIRFLADRGVTHRLFYDSRRA